jgi:hypothetical protein
MDTETNKTDLAVSLAKGVIGAAPIVGPLIAEAIGVLIPNQGRLDRISRLVAKLDAKVAGFNQEWLREQLKNQEFIDLLEDSFVQASRALSEERLEYLSSLLKNSLSADKFSHIESKRVLALLSELNDMEVIILASHTAENHPHRNPEFWSRHEAVLTPRSVHHGSSDRQIDEAAIYESYRQHLVQLGLLRPYFRSPRKGELPELDYTIGTMRAAGHQVSRLGDLLLLHIDLTKHEQTVES